MTATSESPVTASPARRVFRVEVWPRAGEPDAVAAATLAQAKLAVGSVGGVRIGRVYLFEAALNEAAVERVARELLADPINQEAVLGADPQRPHSASIEVHYQPGVMDPVAQSTRDAIVEMFPGLDAQQVEVRTGFRYDFIDTEAQVEDLRRFAARALANPVIQDIHVQAFIPERFPSGSDYTAVVRHVPLRELDDAALVAMSRQAHLFLSLEEMRAIRDYFRTAGREPTDVELETLAQTWSEHCVHKTLKSTVQYSEPGGKGMSIPTRVAAVGDRPGHTLNPDGSVTIQNLLKSTIAAATHRLMQDPDLERWCVSVFKDNAGIVTFDSVDGVCIKVETHNHPSAIEPYGGAATGIGGCIRDVMGTGLAAKPIANMDVFCVARARESSGFRVQGSELKNPDAVSANPEPGTLNPELLPKGVIPPGRILRQVVAGVRDYGNRMGIPTVNGAVWFHDDYLANPLVFAGCVGLIPLDKCFGQVQRGDRIIALGGRTGRDGIHGATFSSAELTDTHADEFAHAVQIGNAITQKRVLDVILQARDVPPEEGGPLFHALTDCGAGGFSSAVGEMAKDLGARVTLETAPLKYRGLSYTEIWISEAQERMVLAVPPEHVERLRGLCTAEDVEMCDLGEFGWAPDASAEASLLLTYQGTEVGCLAMHFLHDGIPTPTRAAEWVAAGPPVPAAARKKPVSPDVGAVLTALLSHPNIASKHWIIRQYDHEVQGGSVVKPLVGPEQDGPGDAAVIRPKLDSDRAIAIGCGLQTGLSEKTPGGDSYWMALAALDEAVRNVVCAGADPTRIALLDNFCWPRCDDPRQLGSLVRAAEGCYDGAIAYRAPFVSGKDSLSNQFTTEDGRLITIPPTLLITAMGIVPSAARSRTMDAKTIGSALLVVGRTGSEIGGSHYTMISAAEGRDERIPHVDLEVGPRTAAAVAALITQGAVLSAHDCSDGGLLVAAAEMAFAGRVGLDMDLDTLPVARELDDITACFAETPSRYLLEVAPDRLDEVLRALRQVNVPHGQVGRFAKHQRLTLRCGRHGRLLDASLDDLRAAWMKPLDW